MGAGGLSDVERPKLGNDLYKHPFRTQMVAMDPVTGLPRVVSGTSMEDSAAPPLDSDSFVCMADESAFVIRDIWGEVLLEIEPSRAKWCAGDPVQGLPSQWLAVLSDEERTQARMPSVVLGGDQLWCRVQPLRVKCEHYCRVMTDFEGDAVIKRVERVCTAQRTEAGEYTSLADTRVYACDHRYPPDFVSADRLRKFDAVSIAASKKTEFRDGEAALERALREQGDPADE